MYEKLKQYCKTQKQLEKIEAIIETGSIKSAAKKLNVSYEAVYGTVTAVKVRAASSGYADEAGWDYGVPDGFKLKGVSDMRTNHEGKPVWFKVDADKERQKQILEETIKAMSQDVTRAEPVICPKKTNSQLLTTYPVGDHHFGMLAHADLGGENYNVKRAEALLCGAMDYLVDGSPDSDEAAILLLGDFLHYDNMIPTTKSGHILDADSRFPKVVRAAIRTIRYLVESALKKHKNVRLIIEKGNHDESSTVILQETFFLHYENEPRVTVDRSPQNCHVFQFGRNLIGTHHGDKIKMDKLPLVIASDYPKIWGDTKYRTIMTGHIHHDIQREFAGIMIESFGILAPKDAYASDGGYRAKQTMKAIYFHSEFGEIGRNIVNPAILGI